MIEYYCPNCGLKYYKTKRKDWICVICFNLFDKEVFLQEVKDTTSLFLNVRDHERKIGKLQEESKK